MLLFKLSMPNVGSWNGKWTSEGSLFAKTEDIRGSRAKELLGSYIYDFGDGWSAKINVEEISGKEAAKIRRKSKGFCGYDWMIKSIINNKKIIFPKQ